jgi:CrcB protein
MTAPVAPPVTAGRAGLIAFGGAAGATARWALQEALGPPALDSIPWALVVVNTIGSGLLAWAIVESRRRPARAGLLVDGLGSGFCGGLTTFSAFALVTATQLRDGSVGWAIAAVLVVLGGSIGAAVLVARTMAATTGKVTER